MLLELRGKKNHYKAINFIPTYCHDGESTTFDIEYSNLGLIYQSIVGYFHDMTKDYQPWLMVSNFGNELGMDGCTDIVPVHFIYTNGPEAHYDHTENKFYFNHDPYFEPMLRYIYMDFCYELAYHNDKDTPVDPVTISLFNGEKFSQLHYERPEMKPSFKDQDTLDSIREDIRTEFEAYNDNGKWVFTDRKPLESSAASTTPFNLGDIYFRGECTLHSLCSTLTRYSQFKIAIDMLQSDFRLDDILDGVDVQFNCKLIEGSNKCNWNDPKLEDGKIFELKEEDLMDALRILYRIVIPDTTAQSSEFIKPKFFKFLGGKFRAFPIPSTPITGFLLPKKYIDLFYFMDIDHTVECDIEIYDHASYAVRDVISFNPVKNGMYDMLSVIELIVDFLASKYDSMVKANFKLRIAGTENETKDLFFVIDHYHVHSSTTRHPIEKLYYSLLEIQST